MAYSLSEEEFKKVIKEKLCNLFDYNKLSNTSAGEILGCSSNTIKNWRDGKTVPNAVDLFNVSQKFALPYSWFLDNCDFTTKSEVDTAAEYPIVAELETKIRALEEDSARYKTVIDVLLEGKAGKPKVAASSAEIAPRRL